MGIQSFVEAYVIPAQLVCAMLGMGATLSVREFIDVIKDARGLLIGLGLQLVFVPVVAVTFISILGLEKGWAVGLILVAVVPGGAFSNLLTYLGKGNAALSVSVTTVSNVGCIVTIPLLLHFLVADYMPPEFRVPAARIIGDIFRYLLVPLLAGMIVLRVSPVRAPAVARWSIRASLLFLLVVVVSSLTSGRIRIAEYGIVPPLLIILFGNLLWVVSAQVCRLLGRADPDNVALTLEVSIRNVALALLLVHFFFAGEAAQGHVLYTCLFYAGMSFFIGIPIVLRHRRGESPALFWPPRPARTPARVATEPAP